MPHKNNPFSGPGRLNFNMSLYYAHLDDIKVKIFVGTKSKLIEISKIPEWSQEFDNHIGPRNNFEERVERLINDYIQYTVFKTGDETDWEDDSPYDFEDIYQFVDFHIQEYIKWHPCVEWVTESESTTKEEE